MNSGFLFDFAIVLMQLNHAKYWYCEDEHKREDQFDEQEQVAEFLVLLEFSDLFDRIFLIVLILLSLLDGAWLVLVFSLLLCSFFLAAVLN